MKTIGRITELKAKPNYQNPGRVGLAGTGGSDSDSSLSFSPPLPFSECLDVLASLCLIGSLYIRGT